MKELVLYYSYCYKNRILRDKSSNQRMRLHEWHPFKMHQGPYGRSCIKVYENAENALLQWHEQANVAAPLGGIKYMQIPMTRAPIRGLWSVCSRSLLCSGECFVQPGCTCSAEQRLVWSVYLQHGATALLHLRALRTFRRCQRKLLARIPRLPE